MSVYEVHLVTATELIGVAGDLRAAHEIARRAAVAHGQHVIVEREGDARAAALETRPRYSAAPPSEVVAHVLDVARRTFRMQPSRVFSSPEDWDARARGAAWELFALSEDVTLSRTLGARDAAIAIAWRSLPAADAIEWCAKWLPAELAREREQATIAE